MLPLSYILVILFSSISLAISSFFSIIFSLFLFWLPANKLAPATSFLSGLAGPFLSVIISKYIFIWVAGLHIYTIEMYLAAILPLAIPIYKDYKKYRNFEDEEGSRVKEINNVRPSNAATMGAFPLGALIGIIFTILYFNYSI